MSHSPVFEATCEQLEQRTSLDRLASRGTLRIALRESGLNAEGVDTAQMAVVLKRVLPAQLESRGIEDAPGICDQIATHLAGLSFEQATDRASAAADAIARFGS